MKENRHKKNWTNEEIEYLQENWGNKSTPLMAQHLGRTVVAVCVKAQKLGLGAFFDNSYKYITKHQLFLALGLGQGSDSYKNISWIKNRGLKLHKIIRKKQTFEVICLDEFWKWAYKNQTFIDFSRFEKYALGPEPEWVDKKRRDDVIRSTQITTAPWTPVEDIRLKRLLKEKKYTYFELSKILHRTDGAIQKRICYLKIKEHPIKADNQIRWTDEDYDTLAEMIKAGDKYEKISSIIGKSVKAIRGRVYFMYYTENLDKVRSYIGNGNWGDGKPIARLGLLKIAPKEEREFAKSLLANFAFYLRKHAKNISCVSDEFKDYWQKDVCEHWDDALGCTVGVINCDKSNDFCNECREARLRQARKKYAYLYNHGRINDEGKSTKNL